MSLKTSFEITLLQLKHALCTCHTPLHSLYGRTTHFMPNGRPGYRAGCKVREIARSAHPNAVERAGRLSSDALGRRFSATPRRFRHSRTSTGWASTIFGGCIRRSPTSVRYSYRLANFVRDYAFVIQPFIGRHREIVSRSAAQSHHCIDSVLTHIQGLGIR